MPRNSTTKTGEENTCSNTIHKSLKSENNSNIKTLITFTQSGQRKIYNSFKKWYYIIIWVNPLVAVKKYFASLDAIWCQLNCGCLETCDWKRVRGTFGMLPMLSFLAKLYFHGYINSIIVHAKACFHYLSFNTSFIFLKICPSQLTFSIFKILCLSGTLIWIKSQISVHTTQQKSLHFCYGFTCVQDYDMLKT